MVTYLISDPEQNRHHSLFCTRSSFRHIMNSWKHV